MKIPALLTVAALACGAAFAQGTTSDTALQPQSGTTSDQGIARGNHVDGTLAKSRSNTTAMGNAGTASTDMSQPAASADMKAAKTADTTKHMHKGKKVAKKSGGKHQHVAMHHSTRSMGASGSMTDLNAHDRQARMDAAYNDWLSKKK